MSKKILLAAIAFFLSLGMLFAQAPQQFNYQGVARNTSGQPLANQNIGLQLTVRTGTATGTIQYRETHNVTTNAYGLYNVAVGGGTVVTGAMNTVTWGAGSKFMQVQIDPNGGTNYTNLGSTELLSVPYALYAESSANINGTTNRLIKFTGATTGGNSQITDDGTRVSVGAAFATNSIAPPRMSIQSTNNGPALEIDATAGASGIYVKNNAGAPAIGGESNGIAIAGHSNNGVGIWATSDANGSHVNSSAVKGNNSGTGTSIYGYKGNSDGHAGQFTSLFDGAKIDSGIVRIAYTGATTSKDHIGLDVHVVPNPADNYGIGVKGFGGWRGVFGESSHTGAGANVGVYGFGRNSGGNSYGLFGVSHNNTGSTTGSKYGIYATAYGGSTNYAGYFASGNVQVSNMLSKGGGTFKIDHPLDPENKYLYHSFVESPDMMNIYNGNITTDAQGYATVTMPDYFTALNVDFRYQLTVIGTFAQAIVKNKINGNSFVIQTNQPNVEVSWQVTGVRNDKFAQANRVQVEVEKPEDEKGLYLHSEAWGQSKDKDLNYIMHQKPIEDKEAEGRE